MMKSKTVVLWGMEEILIASVKFILASQKEWKVVSIPNNGEVDALILALDTTHADTVILHEDGHHDPAILTMQLCKDHPALRVIIISLDNNTMDVYSKQKITVQEASDLIAAIENVP